MPHMVLPSKISQASIAITINQWLVKAHLVGLGL